MLAEGGREGEAGVPSPGQLAQRADSSKGQPVGLAPMCSAVWSHRTLDLEAPLGTYFPLHQ